MNENDKIDKMEILRELVSDWRKGVINDFSAMIVVSILVDPKLPDELDIKWAREIIKLRENE